MRQPRRLPEALTPADVAAFVADLRTFRDRAITLVMLLGGLRAAEVRSLRLADVDMGLRRVRVTGKGGKERVVPVDGVFFAELGAYLREERPAGCRTAECFVVLRGPTAGQPLTEPGCGGSSAPTGWPRGRCGCGRTGCVIPMLSVLRFRPEARRNPRLAASCLTSIRYSVRHVRQGRYQGLSLFAAAFDLTWLTCLSSGNRHLPTSSQDPVQITYGTELACAGIDLLALRELMGHANPETTAAYVKSRELHQPGEKPQVTRSRRCRNGVSDLRIAAV